MAKQYYGDDTVSVVGGLFVSLFQLTFALFNLVFVGVRELIRFSRRR